MGAAGRDAGWAVATGLALVALLLLSAIAAIGGERGDVPARVAAVAYLAVKAGVPAAAYVLGAIGIGRLAARLWRGAENPWPIQAGAGLALMLTLSHGLGVLGLLNQWTAAGAVGAGLVLLAQQLAAARARGDIEPRLPAWAALGLVPAAVLLVAACQPPGWLWASEAGGYDALSYHLQLPREWVRAGRIAPVEHNVYSYLPGYVEAAFTHVAVMCGAVRGAPGGWPDLLAGEGWLLVSCQLLHAGIAVLAAWLVARAGAGAASACGAGREASRRAGAIGGCLLLATPWMVVVGSLAYNEMAMVALGAAALVAAVDRGYGRHEGTEARRHEAEENGDLRPWQRGTLVGLLVSGACGCKPTAILFIAPAVGVVMVVRALAPKSEAHFDGAGVAPEARGHGAQTHGHGRRGVIVMFGACAAAGLVMLVPWLVRNWAHGGNPVLPAAGGLFGTAHWDAEQAARYARGHRFEGTIGERLRLLVMPEKKTGTAALEDSRAVAPGAQGQGGGGDTGGTPMPRAVVEREDPARSAGLPGTATEWRGTRNHRGMLHPQWGMFFPAVLAAGVAAIAGRATRAIGLALVAGLVVQVLAWMFLTHLQSRFLIPLAVGGCVLAALAAAREGGAGRVARGVLALVIVAQSAATVWRFAQERGGDPSGLLMAGPGALTGQLMGDAGSAAPGALPPPAEINLRRLPGRVYLLGGATPLYFAAPVLYNTTWDRWALGDAMRRWPDEPGRWAGALRQIGVRWVLADFAEIERLQASGWADPDVTPQRAAAWLRDHARLVREWPGGVALFDLGEAR